MSTDYCFATLNFYTILRIAELFKKPAIFISALDKIINSNYLVDESLLNDISLCMYCCSLNYKSAQIFYNLLEKNKDLTFWYCYEFSDRVISCYLPKKYLDDKNLAKFLCSKNINNYISFSSDIRDDINFFNDLKEEKYKVFSFSGDSIKSDLNIILEVLSIQPKLYIELDSDLQKNPNFFLSMLDSLQTNIELLKYAPKEIQDNEHCVWQAVLKNPKNLSHASFRLLNSTSFASQVIRSMNSEQIADSFDFWTEHVKNNTSILEEILPSIMNAKCLYLAGSDVKSNYQFMLKAMLLDSKQTLNCCPPLLLENSSFIIEAYNRLNFKNEHKNCYDLNSEQNNVFDYISDKSSNNEKFIIDLYSNLDDIFITIIFPKIRSHKNQLMNTLNISYNQDKLKYTLDKILLQHNLDNDLPNKCEAKKKFKL